MSTRPDIRLVTFDADQTLSDFYAVLEIALRETTAFLNRHLDEPIEAQTLQAMRMRYANDPEYAHTPMLELRRLGIADALAGHSEQSALTEQALALFRDIRFSKVRALPFADELIGRLHGKVRLGWITNANSRPEHIGYDGKFDVTILAEDVGFRKPQAEIFEMALAAVGDIGPGQWLHVGDDLVADVGGAKNAGGRAIWYDHGKDEPKADIMPDHRISCLSEMPEILESYTLIHQ